MATKKQKHEAAMARREKWLADRRESGLRAQKQDRDVREYRRHQAALREAAKDGHKKHSKKKPDKNCILCQDLIKAQHKKKDQEGSSGD